MMKKIGFTLILLLIFCSNIFADTQGSIDSGLNWLLTNQNSDGSFGNQTDLIFRDTEEVLNTLYILNQKDSQYQSGLQWIQSTKVNNIDFIARKILILSKESIDTTTGIDLLISNQRTDGGWGIATEYENNSIDAAFALQALNASNYSDQTITDSALSYLLGNQNSDGGFGFYSGDESNVYMTAVVLYTLQQFSQTTSIATARNNATDYLISQQQTNGSWGTIYETALSYIALVSEITDNTVLGNAITYLINNQSSDGSWNQDAYSTALALRALYLSANKSTPPSSATGTIEGKVVDASSNQPLNGVSVSAIGSQQSATTITDSNGAFTLSDLSAGSYTVTFALSGYSTGTLTVNVTGGSSVNLGTVSLSSNLISLQSTTITGKVTDASTGNPITNADVSIIEANSTTKTDSRGSYTFTEINLFEFNIKASATGYDSKSYAVETTNYGTYNFDFGLSPSRVSDLKITSVSLDKQIYNANEDVFINATIENTGNTEIKGIISAEVQDTKGNVIAIISSETLEGITFSPSTVYQTTIQWNTDQFSPGNYEMVLKVMDSETVNIETHIGTILAEKAISFSIVSSVDVTGEISFTPSVTYTGSTETVTINLLLSNKSNISADLVIEHTMKTPSGITLDTDSTSVVLTTDYLSKNITLSTFTYDFTESGEYLIDVVIYNEGTILTNINSVFTVLSNIRLETSKTVDPETVLPGESGKVRITIELKGIEAK